MASAECAVCLLICTVFALQPWPILAVVTSMARMALHATPMRFELIQHVLLSEVDWERFHTHA